MFNIFKKKPQLISPIDGKIIDLKDVPDPVFAQKLAGDGAAVDSTGDTIFSPADGTLTLVFRTNHAFGLTLDNGAEVLVHIGLDTVHLNGQFFKRIAEQGTKVKAGDPIIKIDRKAILDEGYSLITPVLITNREIIKNIDYSAGKTVIGGRDVILTYKIK